MSQRAATAKEITSNADVGDGIVDRIRRKPTKAQEGRSMRATVMLHGDFMRARNGE